MLRRGFTLIELMVVIAIMAGVLAVAAPRLLPVFVYSTHEGAARHMANFGTAAMAEAELTKETLIFKADIENQEYWCERLPEPPDDVALKEQEEESKELAEQGLPEDDAELEAMAQEELERELTATGRGEDGTKVLDEQARRMGNASDKHTQSVLKSRAARVKHDEKALHNEKMKDAFKLGPEAEVEPEEVSGTLIGRTRLPEEITLIMVELGGKAIEEGVAEVELTPAGIQVEAKFYLMNQEGSVFVVTWDPKTGRTGFGLEDA